MKKLLGSLVTVAVLLALAAPVLANDCCWDWNPDEQGANDGPSPPVKVNASATWAECVPLTNPGCFERGGMQQFWGDYECVVDGAVAPDASVPEGGHGYYCRNKISLSSIAFGDKSQGRITSPPNSYPSVGVLIEAVLIPATSLPGMLLLGLVMLIAAIWFLRRNRTTVVASH